MIGTGQGERQRKIWAQESAGLRESSPGGLHNVTFQSLKFYILVTKPDDHI